MKKDEKYIAVLLTVHNRKDKTLRCLRELYAQQLPEGYVLDVWLTNDGCTDGTPEAIANEFPQVNIVEGDGTLFWNRGMHKAWVQATKHRSYDYYLWLNDDTYISECCLLELLQSAQSTDNQAIIVGTTCGTTNPNVITYGGRKRVDDAPIVPNGELQECRYVNGNIVLVPSYVYDRIGTNDPYFRHAIGDNDYGLRAIKQGIKCYVTPQVVGQCDRHEHLDTWCDPAVPFTKRWPALRRATGIQPEQFFVFTRRHRGIITALKVYGKIHVRCLFPSLWVKKNVSKEGQTTPQTIK